MFLLFTFLIPGINMQFQPPISKFQLSNSVSWLVSFLGRWEGYVESWAPAARVVLNSSFPSTLDLLFAETFQTSCVNKTGKTNPCLEDKEGRCLQDLQTSPQTSDLTAGKPTPLLGDEVIGLQAWKRRPRPAHLETAYFLNTKPTHIWETSCDLSHLLIPFAEYH